MKTIVDIRCNVVTAVKIIIYLQISLCINKGPIKVTNLYLKNLTSYIHTIEIHSVYL